MNFTILIPHWKTGPMTAYAVAQILKHKGRHSIEVHVVDNNPGDGSIEYLDPFVTDIHILDYPSNEFVQSQGIGFDHVLQRGINTDYFICMESDSFPTNDKWLDYYEMLIVSGVDMAGSLFKLSGGEYVHPCGAMYKYSNWLEARAECMHGTYMYIPHIAMKEGHACHLMLRSDMFTDFMEAPEDYVELSESYTPFDIEKANDKIIWYLPATHPFHNGMGSNDESVKTYGARTILSETKHVLLDNKKKMIKRVGYEPGQWLTYWHYAMNKRVEFIPTTIQWLKDAVQQEYTLTRNGVRHLWGISSHLTAEGEIADKKRKQVIDLYNSLPEELKIEHEQSIV